jgi:hypothetical protein
MRFYAMNKNKHERLLDIHANVVTVMDFDEVRKERKIKKFVLYENYVCDVTKYIDAHPGGRNLISDNLYCDVGRYVTGTQAYNKDFHAWDHNFSTYVHILHKLAYAELTNDSNIIQNFNGMNHFLDDWFEILNRREIAQNIYELRITSDELSFARFIPGHRWFGKHISVTSLQLNKTRYYTTCLILDHKLRDKHVNLMKQMRETVEKISEISLKTSNYFNIYCKRYDYPDALSNQMYENEEEFNIKGPLV